MTQVSKCRCGKDAHPCYTGRCEDCWVADNRGVYVARGERMKVVKVLMPGRPSPGKRSPR